MEKPVVTEKASNLIDVYTVSSSEIHPGLAYSLPLEARPFGFGLGKRRFDRFRAGGAPMPAQHPLSLTYAGLQVGSASALAHQTAACWIAVTQNGKYAYTMPAAVQPAATRWARIEPPVTPMVARFGPGSAGGHGHEPQQPVPLYAGNGSIDPGFSVNAMAAWEQLVKRQCRLASPASPGKSGDYNNKICARPKRLSQIFKHEWHVCDECPNFRWALYWMMG
jgi:hypothetical protein